MRGFIAAGLLGGAAVALSSGVEPWLGALAGAFVPADIAQDVAAARLFDAGVNPYGPVIRDVHSTILPLPVEATFPYFPHPPFSLLVSWGFAYVSFETAALIWLGVTLALIFILAALLTELYSAAAGGHRAPAQGLLFVLLLCWPPVLYNLEKGQWSILLAVLVGLAVRSLSRSRLAAVGFWTGAAAAVKVFPVVLGGYLLLRSRRAFGWFLLTGIVLTALPLLRIGFDALPAFIGQSRMNLPHWETFPSVTLSIHGAVARLFHASEWSRPIAHAPGLALVIDVLVVVTLLGLATYATLRPRGDRSYGPIAGWIAMLPVLNPQSLGHNAVLLALPLILTAAILRADNRWWLKAGWALGLILVSIPRQTTWRLAPPPVEPWQGLAIVALPMWGALLLFAVAVVLAVRPVPDQMHS